MHTLQQLQSGELKGIKNLVLQCGLTAFPREIFTLAATLEILDMSDNSLSSLPDDFAQLKQLKIVFFGNNAFTVFPEVLSQCPQLSMIGFKGNKISHISETALPVTTRWLILTSNQLTELPKAIGNCLPMQKLALAGNRLKSLPDELSKCKNLGLLRISANQLEELPAWLLTMPKLSWLAFAGNPFCNEIVGEDKKLIEAAGLPCINWQELALTNQLGQGASGVISKALWQGAGAKPLEVAVKLFKGEVTSDGYPDDEMAACMLAGNHPNLVTVLGKIQNHPEDKQGLVLELIPPDFYNLGLPPSYESCTRDVFATGSTFSIPRVIAIAKAIASAAAHLHKKGIMHGDLYAHNTLINDKNETFFGDFGAATLYDISSPEAAVLQRFDVSAFGCMIEDLLSCVVKNETNLAAFDALVQIKGAAMQPDILRRPDFTTLCSMLETIAG